MKAGEILQFRRHCIICNEKLTTKWSHNHICIQDHVTNKLHIPFDLRSWSLSTNVQLNQAKLTIDLEYNTFIVDFIGHDEEVPISLINSFMNKFDYQHGSYRVPLVKFTIFSKCPRHRYSCDYHLILNLDTHTVQSVYPTIEVFKDKEFDLYKDHTTNSLVILGPEPNMKPVKIHNFTTELTDPDFKDIVISSMMFSN